MKTSRDAFTLVEIMIVIAIIGMLATISYPSYEQSRDNARRAICQNQLRVLAGAAEMQEFEQTSEDDATLEDLAPHMKTGELPECPSGGVYTLQLGSDPIVICSYGDGHEL